MKIGIIGNYGATNIGDDAILSSILASHSRHDFTVFCANPRAVAKQFHVDVAPLFPFGFRSYWNNGFFRSKRALKEMDAIVLGGGGLMQDNYRYAAMLWAWQVGWTKRYNKPLFVYANGVGPLVTGSGRNCAKFVFNYANAITVRDESSRRLLYEFGISDKNILLTADPAFLLKAPKSYENIRRQNGLILISLRPWLNYDQSIIEVFTRFLQYLKEKKNVDFRFVCMQQIEEHDHQIIDPIAKELGGDIFIPSNFTELLGAMKEAEFAIGMRYHFLIAALMTQTPVLPISYSPKIDSLFKGTSLENYMMKVDKLNFEELEDLMIRLSVDYNNIQVYQKARYEQLQGLAKGNIKAFNNFLDEIQSIC